MTLAPERSFSLLLASRHKSPARTSVPRIALAVMLALVVLAGIAPLSSLSVAAHECGMACCAGKPSHMAGSCSIALDGEEEMDASAESGAKQHSEQHSAHARHETPSPNATSETGAPVKPRRAAKKSSVHPANSGAVSREALSLASQAVTTPCSPECAVATSLSVQVRRPREHSALIGALRLHPFEIRSLIAHHGVLPPKSAEAGRPTQPRAPPTPLINFSA
jgi:hypothetical protein